MHKRIKLENALYVIAYDGKRHRLMPGGTVVYEGNTIVYVGKNYEGPADETVDASGHIIMPGLVNIHAHCMFETKNKGFIEDRGSRKLWMTGLIEYLPATGSIEDPDSDVWVLRYALTELLKSGCTTVAEIGRLTQPAVEALGESGMRVYFGPMYRDARWYTKNGHEVLYEWNTAAGMAGLRQAVDFIEKQSGRFGDRLRGFLAPAQVDTCTPELLRESKAAQAQLGVPLQIHACQSVSEWLEMMRRHGMTPIEWLGSLGVLDEQTIIGHALFLNHHSWINYKDHDDLALLAETGTSVAHCPWVFGRRGMHMESFGGYVRRGINVGLGTDTVPQNMLAELRWAAVLSKNASGDVECGTAAEAFDAATLGSAKALGRDDLGRLAAGAKADIVLLNANHMDMRPLRDPIKNIVYNASPQAVDTVIVDGQVLVKGGKVLGVDEDELVRKVQEAAERTWRNVPQNDWAGRTAEQMSPLSYELWDGE